MPLEEDVETFRIWATNLGCPQDSIPNEEALKSIFKSPQRELFCNMMTRVQPRQTVKAVRENILINHMGKLKGIESTCSRNSLPKEMQIYLKKKDLMKKQEALEATIEDYRKEYNDLDGYINSKSIKSVSLNDKLESLRAKSCVLELKSKALDDEIRQELQNKEKIIATMPVKLTEHNANDKDAVGAVQKALEELENFYSDFIASYSSDAEQAGKTELWKKMRSIFNNIPNFFIFNTIMRMKEEQLQNIKALNSSKINESSNGYSPKEPLSAYRIKFNEARADLLGVVAKWLRTRQEHAEIEERFAELYVPFVDELRKKIVVYNDNDDEHTDDIISDFLVQYNLHHFLNSKIESVKQQVELYQMEIAAGAKQLENHDVLIGSVRQMYRDINTSINRVQQEMSQLEQIKERINYSKNLLRMAFEDVQVHTNFQSTRFRDITQAGGDSFEMGGDSVFCSTKLDFDASVAFNRTAMQRSFLAPDATMVPGLASAADGRHFQQPQHLFELNVFAEVPMENFLKLTRECAFYLSANPLVIESRELSSTLQLTPGVLLTPYGALQEVRAHFIWADAIAAHSNDFKLNLNSIIVDVPAYKERMRKQREHIVELLDRIKGAASNTNHTLDKISQYYKFILENPLRRHIPATKCFNNQTYADYEAAFLMYYRMATGGAITE